MFPFFSVLHMVQARLFLEQKKRGMYYIMTESVNSSNQCNVLRSMYDSPEVGHAQ